MTLGRAAQFFSMRGPVSLLLLGAVVSACGTSADFRSLTLCELGKAATLGGKGTLLPGEGPVRTFQFSSHLIGSQPSVVFSAGEAARWADQSDGGAYLFTWTVGAGVTEVMSQGLFYEFVPGRYANSGIYRGGVVDGQASGGVDETELVAEIARGTSVDSVTDCRPSAASNRYDAGR